MLIAVFVESRIPATIRVDNFLIWSDAGPVHIKRFETGYTILTGLEDSSDYARREEERPSQTCERDAGKVIEMCPVPVAN